MHQVEELCDRLVLIDSGQALLYGTLDEVRRKFAKPSVLITTHDALPETIQGVGDIEKVNGNYLLHLINGAQPNDVLKSLVEKKITLEKFEIALPTLDEIFIEVVNKQGGVR
jgi:ABC-2 type transport system ATP-binding protein